MGNQAGSISNRTTMESPERSPESDFYGDDSKSTPTTSTSANTSSQQAIALATTNQEPSTEAPIFSDSDDGASDVSMHAESDDEAEPITHIKESFVVTSKQHSQSTASADNKGAESRKRKYSTSSEIPNGHLESEADQEDCKRLKPDGDIQLHEPSAPLDRSLLPAEIWHNVFTFCPPRVLGQLLRVNKVFNAYLNPSPSNRALVPLLTSALKLLSPDSIWAASRKLLNLLGMPSPLSGKSELDMWKMASGSMCEFCSKKRLASPAFPVDQWHSGPGENGVVPVWQFGVSICGKCLEAKSVKVGLFLVCSYL